MGAVGAAAFTDQEVAEAIARHPELARTGPGTVEGGVIVHAEYEGEVITDRFEVRITSPDPASGRVPTLYEIGGRTVAIAAKWSRTDLRDLHRNPGDGSACVCVKQEEATWYPPGSDLSVFIDGLASNYLYGLAYYERHGRWPWGERSHGALGILEFYADNAVPLTQADIEAIVPYFLKEGNWLDYDRQLRRPRRGRCLCGSGKLLEKCHPTAFQGVQKLAAEIRRLGIKRRGLFQKVKARLAKNG